jgi:hypothetical protein
MHLVDFHKFPKDYKFHYSLTKYVNILCFACSDALEASSDCFSRKSMSNKGFSSPHQMETTISASSQQTNAKSSSININDRHLTSKSDYKNGALHSLAQMDIVGLTQDPTDASNDDNDELKTPQGSGSQTNATFQLTPSRFNYAPKTIPDSFSFGGRRGGRGRGRR